MANADQIQSLAKVVSEFAKTSEVPFQNPGEFHAKFFEYVSGDRPDQTTEDGRVLIIALRDVIFATSILAHCQIQRISIPNMTL